MPGLTAYGHSWVAGAGASDPAYRLVDVVARRLGTTATNLGVGGSLSTDTAALVSRQRTPASEVYLLMTGLNDARLYGASPPGLAGYAAALSAIVTALGRAGRGAPILAVLQPHLLDYSLHAPHHRGSDDVIDAYNERLRAVADRHPDVTLVTVHGWSPVTMLAADRVHPADAGHAQVADAVVRTVQAVRGSAVGGHRQD